MSRLVIDRGRALRRRLLGLAAAAVLTVPTSCVTLGPSSEAYQRGQRLLAADRPREAEVAFQTSCLRDRYGGGCTAAGLLYLEGRGVRRDRTTGIDLLIQGCQGGDPGGCIALRELPPENERPEPGFTPAASQVAEFGEAIDRYRTSCFDGDPDACLGAGVLISLGWGIDRNRYNGSRLVQKACRMGSELACRESGVGAASDRSR